MHRPSRRALTLSCLAAVGILCAAAVLAWPGVAALPWSSRARAIGRAVRWDAATAHLILTDTVDGRVIRSVALDEPPDPAAAQGLGPSGNAIVTMAADARRGHIYVAQLAKGIIHAYAASDGHQLWQASLLPRTFRPDGRQAIQAPVPVEASGLVVSADVRDGRVILLRPDNGCPRATLAVPPGGLDVAVVRKTRRIFVFHSGAVDVLDDASGRRLAAVTFGAPYQFGPAHVNQQTGRVFLVNGQGQFALALDGATGRVIPLQRAGAPPPWPPPSLFVARPVLRVPPDRWAWVPAAVRQRLPFIPSPPRPQPYRASYQITIDTRAGG